MKIKTQNLTNHALDWAVATLEKLPKDVLVVVDGRPIVHRTYLGEITELRCEFSAQWSQGGPIMERERICITYPRWDGQATALKIVEEFDDRWEMHGLTPLVAAMRCYVASKMGAEVEVPDELV